MEFPQVRFPRCTRAAIARCWALYWLRFLALLPFMLVRQAILSAQHALAGWWTANRTYRLMSGRLDITYLGSWQVLPTTAIFGERFTLLRYGSLVLDPGPLFAARTVAGLDLEAHGIVAVVATHLHEEHIGNAATLARRLGVAIHGTRITLDEIAQPQPLSPGRRMLMGQPLPAPEAQTRLVSDIIMDGVHPLEVIDAPGHCAGHIALFDRQSGVLLAGDSFLHQIFTAPNGDVSHAQWMETLRRFAALEVTTLVGAHGHISSIAEGMPAIPFVVKRQDPRLLIRTKLRFMEWATATVAEGERRGLPYSVIEASLFPWQRSWSWSTWFHDESFRLLTCGEFSRTHFVRSLSATPQRVPVRFRTLSAAAERASRHWPTLLRIHLLAGHPFPVFVISMSILLSLGVIELAALAAGARAAGPWWRIDLAIPWLCSHRSLGLLALAMAILAAWWAIIGGAITRWMARAVLSQEREPFGSSLAFCCRWALAAPSLMASSCFVLMLAAPACPWLALPVLPIWLVAGFLYGALTTERMGLQQAWRATLARRHAWRQLLKLQAIFLTGFATSTGLVYLLVGLWCLLAHLVAHGAVAAVVMAPLLLYALGYTTANLKSLQIYLYAAGEQA